MKLKFDPRPSSRYPNGYWYASTDDAASGEVGATPLDAMSALVIAMEEDAILAGEEIAQLREILNGRKARDV